jgi:O-antigen/teichoic acid export membrane protein
MKSFYLSSIALATWIILAVILHSLKTVIGDAADILLPIAYALALFHGLYFLCELKKLRRLERERHQDLQDSHLTENAPWGVPWPPLGI